MKSEILNILKQKLQFAIQNQNFNFDYFVPSIWLNRNNPEEETVNINPFKFLLNSLEKIEELSKSNPVKLPSKWSQNAIIYNMMPRFTTAYDHNADGEIGKDSFIFGFRETGTFLKCICLLPLIRELGVNTIYLLPITAIGQDGKKGDLGSPYSVKNPYQLDESLAEPAIDLTIEEQFECFVAAAKQLGMKVVLEFVFRTASLDSTLAIKHPDWFYWIKEDVELRESGTDDENKYGPPIFSEEELKLIREKIEKNDFSDLPKPAASYRNLFVETPELVELLDGKIIGVTKSGQKCKIPSAFADWPPDDKQPVWSDVTYLKLFEHQDYNYIAYNTVRMYAQNLNVPENKVFSLWEHIIEIIPYYIEKFDIDGIMLDMGHALPDDLRLQIVRRAKEAKENFVFWEENFLLSKQSFNQGYEAVVGYLPFDFHVAWKMQSLIEMLSTSGSPIPFFATAENHNTPRTASRAGAVNFSKVVWLISNFLPAMPFIHSGFELAASAPMNTGLGFEADEIQKYPPEKLALFSIESLDWHSKNSIIDYISEIAEIRNIFLDLENNYLTDTIELIKVENDNIVAFIRKSNYANFDLLIVANLSLNEKICFTFNINKEYVDFDLINNECDYNITEDKIDFFIEPMSSFIGKLIIEYYPYAPFQKMASYKKSEQ